MRLSLGRQQGDVTDIDEARASRMEAAVRAKRVEVARRNNGWTEIEEVDLVERHRGWLVSATTDAIFLPYRGTVFAQGSATAFSDRAELYFYVTAAGDIVFLEKRGGETWSDIVERQARRKRAAV